MKNRVNEKFIMPIIESFFGSDLGSYEPLNTDDLSTEIEFEQNSSQDESYIKKYVYKKIIDKVSKAPNNKVQFKPKYVITFDADLTAIDEKLQTYNYSDIFYPNTTKKIRYGILKFGNIPILYYIFIPLQDLIRFIKAKENQTEEDINEIENEKVEKIEKKRNRLIDNHIEDCRIEL